MAATTHPLHEITPPSRSEALALLLLMDGRTLSTQLLRPPVVESHLLPVERTNLVLDPAPLDLPVRLKPPSPRETPLNNQWVHLVVA